MNYTKLTINNEEVGLKFGMYSARYLADKLQNGYSFSGDDITEIGIAHVIYSGYLNNCAIKDMKAELTFENVVDFVEESVNDEGKVNALASAMKVWSEAQLSKVTEDTKKKTTSRKLKESPTK